MIITIFSEDDSAKRSILAINLATLCALNHRKVLLADATAAKHSVNWSKRRSAVAESRPQAAVRDIRSLGSELGDADSYFRTHYQDIIVDADGVDSWNADAAMTATDVLVVPIRFYQGDLKAPKSLARRIESLRFYNPRLRILIVDVLTLSACSDAEQLAFDVIKAFANTIPTAAISDVIIQERIDDGRNFERGLTIFDANPPHKRAISEIKDLYQEILCAKDVPLKAGEVGNAIMHAIQRWTHERADGMR
jgi:chromosome partitioning protein